MGGWGVGPHGGLITTTTTTAPTSSQVNGMMIEDKIVFVGPFLRRTDRPAGKELYTNVYIKNLSAEVSDEELNKIVTEFGEVTSCVVMKVGDVL